MRVNGYRIIVKYVSLNYIAREGEGEGRSKEKEVGGFYMASGQGKEQTDGSWRVLFLLTLDEGCSLGGGIFLLRRLASK